MIHWKYNMSDTQTNKSTKFYKQKTKLNRFCNCLIEGDIVDISSISICFDEYYNIIPSLLEFYDGRYTTTYSDVKIVRIVDNPNLNRTYDYKNVLLLYYNDEYVRQNYKNLIKSSQSLKSLVGKYIIDWKYNKNLNNELDRIGSSFIELNYYVYN